MNMWNWKFFLIFGALRINGDCLARLNYILGHRPENAPGWMSTRFGSWFLLILSTLCVGAQCAIVVCQFFWFPWYNVVITDVTAFVAAMIFYVLFFYSLGGMGWWVSYLLLGVAFIAAFSQHSTSYNGDTPTVTATPESTPSSTAPRAALIKTATPAPTSIWTQEESRAYFG